MSGNSKTRYQEEMGRVLGEIQRAYLASSKSAPHPTWWKRWIGRPYRKADVALYLEALRRIHHFSVREAHDRPDSLHPASCADRGAYRLHVASPLTHVSLTT